MGVCLCYYIAPDFLGEVMRVCDKKGILRESHESFSTAPEHFPCLSSYISTQNNFLDYCLGLIIASSTNQIFDIRA